MSPETISTSHSSEEVKARDQDLTKVIILNHAYKFDKNANESFWKSFNIG